MTEQPRASAQGEQDQVRTAGADEARTGDAERHDAPNETSGSLKQEKVEDRPNVSQVTPEDYPKEERQNARP